MARLDPDHMTIEEVAGQLAAAQEELGRLDARIAKDAEERVRVRRWMQRLRVRATVLQAKSHHGIPARAG